MSVTKKTMIILALVLTIMFIFTRKKHWDYGKSEHVEYNKGYNEKFLIIDTIPTLYKETTRIFIREGFTVGGHAVIGSMNGGSRVIEIHDIPNCKPCRKFFLSLVRD